MIYRMMLCCLRVGPDSTVYGAESDGLIAAESLPDLMLGQSETQPIILLYFSFCKGVNGLVVVSPSGRSAYRVSCSNGSYSPPWPRAEQIFTPGQRSLQQHGLGQHVIGTSSAASA